MDHDEGSSSGQSMRFGERAMDARMDFIQQAGLTRMWLAVMKKYISYGVTGTVRLTRLNEEEQEAMAGLFAINMRGRTDIRFTLQELDMSLMETLFKLTVVECLVLLYGDKAVRNHERVMMENEAWDQFCIWAGSYIFLAELGAWLELLRVGKAPGYRAFLECYEVYREQGSSKEWIHAIRALHDLPVAMKRLPVFAALTTGDAHGLDRDQLTGRVFYWGMVARLNEPTLHLDMNLSLEDDSVNMAMAGSDQIRNQYAAMGILLDDMSSNVMIVGWGPYKQLPVVLPLYTVERLMPELPQISAVYVVENPSIFGALIDDWASRGQAVPYALLCTSGQPSLAALRLMDYAVKDAAHIYYSGDYDVKGLEMASLLYKRYGKQFIPWFLDARTYTSIEATNLLSFSDRERRLLSRMQIEWDDELIATLLDKGGKVFQEHIAQKLVDDWKVKESE